MSLERGSAEVSRATTNVAAVADNLVRVRIAVVGNCLAEVHIAAIAGSRLPFVAVENWAGAVVVLVPEQ